MFKKSDDKLSLYDTADSEGRIFPELKKYFSKMEREKSECSVRGYKDSLSRFLIYFNIFSISDMENITKNQLIDFQSSLRDDGLKFTSVNSHLLRIKAFWNDLIYRELIKNEIITKIKALKKSVNDLGNKEIFILTEKEINDMIEYTEDIQEKMMLILMNEFALRREEVTNILLTDVQVGVNGITYLTLIGKGGKFAMFALRQEILEIINNAIAERKSDCKYLFYSKGAKTKITGQAVFDRVIKAAKNAGISEDRIEKIGAHTIRRTAISRWARKYGILVARDMARHSNVQTTEVYAKVTQEDIDKAFLKEDEKEN